MKLSTKGRYAVTAMADIALHLESHGAASAPGGAPLVTLAEISQRQDISLAYLEQLFARLRKAKLVSSVRGPGGGYRLAKPAAETRISEIMSAVDETLRAAAECDGEVGAGCAGSRAACLTHDLWERLSAQVYLLLHEITLADVIAKRVTPCNALPNFEAALEDARRPADA